MKKTMTNKEMIEAVNRINDMQKREADRNEKLFGIKPAYAIRKNKATLLSQLKPYDEAREELLEECRAAERNADGSKKIRKDCLDRWEDGIKELQSIEVEVDIHMVKFSDVENLSLSISDLEAVDFMLEEPEGFSK